MKHVTIGLIGLGTVGTGVARLLTEHAERIARRAGRPIRWKWAAVRDLRKPRDVSLDGVRLTTDVWQLIDDPEVDVIIETMGGIEPALEYVLAALAAGKHVVTANKALLAEHGARVFAQARAAGRAVAFEGSVGGGIPIVQALGFALAANQVQSLAAIVNGTCNFILTRMTSEGLPYDEALRQAQELGYAEADPTLDVDGTDTAHKLAILAQLAFETERPARVDSAPGDRLAAAGRPQVRRRAGLRHQAAGAGQAVARRGSSCGWRRRLVKHGTPLAEVRGPYNAIRVVGDAVGDTLFYGRGAGAMPTASAVVGDLIDVVTGRASAAGADDLERSDSGAGDSAGACQRGQEPVLPPVHDRRPAGRARQAGPDPGRARDQHRQRDPARPRRRCARPEPGPAGDHDPPGRPGRSSRRAGRDRPARRRPCRRASAWASKTEIARFARSVLICDHRDISAGSEPASLQAAVSAARDRTNDKEVVAMSQFSRPTRQRREAVAGLAAACRAGSWPWPVVRR